MIGLYIAGTSPLHRLPTGPKLALLAVMVFCVLALDRPWQIGTALLVTIAGYALARIPWRAACAQLRPLLWMVLSVGAFQLVLDGPRRAAMVSGALVVNVALAALMTLTTRVSAVLDTCQSVLRPLRRIGLDPDRVGLTLALTLRCVPLITGIVAEVSDARKARGVTGPRESVIALAAPTVVRTLRAADRIGEALAARGVGD